MRIFPYRPPVAPDDERSRSPGLFIFFGLLSLVLMALALAFIVVPPALAAHLVIRGGRLGSTAMRLAGYGLVGLWLAGLVLLGRRLMGAQVRPPPDAPDAEKGPGDAGDESAR